MLSVLVKDPAKARKYVNIGTKLEPPTPAYPTTLKEAARLYAHICELVDAKDGTAMTTKEIEKKVEESEDEEEIWDLKREKFRIEIREQYHDMLLEMAHENWLKKEVRLQ